MTRKNKTYKSLAYSLSQSYYTKCQHFIYGDMDDPDLTKNQCFNEELIGPFEVFGAIHNRGSSVVIVTVDLPSYGGKFSLDIRLDEFVEMVKAGKVRDGKLYTSLVGKRCGGSRLFFGEKED